MRLFSICFALCFTVWGQTPTIAHHSITSCTNGSSTCALTSQIIGTNGNTAYVSIKVTYNGGGSPVTNCPGVSCPCTVTVTDGVNSYATVTNAEYQDTGTSVYVFVAVNATAGTRTITFTMANSPTCTINYSRAFFIDVAGISASPIDTAVSTNNHGSSTGWSMTSAGPVTNVNELALVAGSCISGSPVIASTSSYTLLDSGGGGADATFYLSNPTQGATTTFSATCTPGATWGGSMIALIPPAVTLTAMFNPTNTPVFQRVGIISYFRRRRDYLRAWILRRLRKPCLLDLMNPDGSPVFEEDLPLKELVEIYKKEHRA